ncbi:hypothetical protein FDECE_2922 [Fusarium decemcellulare]|nr:hypothetical protein FDECE_2922 [Fusarium decemcellulare]
MASPTSDFNPGRETGADDGHGAGSGERTAQKRPAWDTNNDRACKRRASKACLSCRNRKVRCDLVSGGHPCTNCRLDTLDCIVKESHRGRKPAAATTIQVAAETPPVEHQDATSPPRPPPSPPAEPPRTTESPRPSPLPQGRPTDYLVSLSFEDQQGLSPPQEVADEIYVNAYPPNQSDSQSNPSPRNAAPPGRWPVRQSISCAQPPKPNASTPHLPPYIKPLPRDLSPRDLQYLADKGALTIPDEPLRNELLKSYIYMIYPFMPATDIEGLLHPIMMADGRDPVSLLLFQAIMFASVTFVDAELLQARGYASRKAARKDFFSRVRLLYGLDCEPDRLAVLQAVLLMTYWYDSKADDKDTWYWMGIALGIAQTLGLHREPDASRTGPRMRQLRRRIWWACVIRDRLLALGIRRPSRIRNDEFGVSPLTIDDFDSRAPSDTVASVLGDSDITAPSPAARHEVASIVVELTQLCLCLGHILHSQYSLMGNQPAGSEFLLKAIVVPQQSKTQQDELVKCDAELDEWLIKRDPRSKYTPTRPVSGDSLDEATRIIQLHQATLEMIYLATLSILHKPQAFQSRNDGPGVDNARRKASREKVTQAAVATTKLAFHFQASNQLRYLSTSSIPAFLSASLIHLMDIGSADEEVRNISIGRFYQCVQALQELQDMYGSADCAVQFLEAVLTKTKINVPMMRPGLFLSKAEEARPPVAGLARMTPDQPLGPAVAATTPYPSPSSSRNQQANPGPPGGPQTGPFDTIMVLPPSPLNGQFDARVAGNGQFADNQECGEGIPDPLLLGNWVDIDSLVPTLINFEADSNLSMPNNMEGFM